MCYNKACWIDQNENMVSRCVPRPRTINKYIFHLNMANKHNHIHQFLLWLEKHWKTEDGYFQIITTIFGICITDAWIVYGFHIGNQHCHKQMSINDFADLLCHDCLNNKFSDVTYKETTLVIPAGMPEVTTMQMSEIQQSSRHLEPSSKILHHYIQISDAQMAGSSLSHSRASALLWHQTNFHDIIRVQVNEKGVIPQIHPHCAQNDCNVKSVEKSSFQVFGMCTIIITMQ